MNCPCCGKSITLKDRNTPYTGRSGRKISGVYEHSKCGAVLGECYKGDSYEVRLPRFATGNVPPENERYYELTLLGSNGIEHVHGWFDIESRCITQTG